MKKINLGQLIGILANLGVIAGIVFLAFELEQSAVQQPRPHRDVDFVILA